MIYLAKSNTLFINVPKNASTSFSTLLKDDADIYSDKHLTLYEIEDIYTIPNNASIVAIIREPFERLLSLYLYRVRQKRYDTCIPSPLDFRTRVLEGDGTLLDHPWQMRLQTDYLPVHRGTWWSYNKINNLAAKLSTKKLLWENKSTSIPYTILLPKFYDTNTYNLVKQRYQTDINLYKDIDKC